MLLEGRVIMGEEAKPRQTGLPFERVLSVPLTGMWSAQNRIHVIAHSPSKAPRKLNRDVQK
jgi:hypothetical protein